MLNYFLNPIEYSLITYPKIYLIKEGILIFLGMQIVITSNYIDVKTFDKKHNKVTANRTLTFRQRIFRCYHQR